MTRSFLLFVWLFVWLVAGAGIPVAGAQDSYWHVDTFNAANLNGNGPGNRAMWCGLPADDPRAAGFYHTPGYGNNWDEWLLYEAAAADPSAPDVVELEFFFNYDHEPGYGDEFTVEYDSAGTWIEVMRADQFDITYPAGSNRLEPGGEFPVPGERFSDHVQRAITYAGGDYGASGDVIAIRLRFRSEGSWSDEDGLWPTAAGAVQVDDLSISHAAGSWFEDFEDGGPWLVLPTRASNATAAPQRRVPTLSVSPNPFNPAVQIRLTVEPGTHGTLEVFDLRGQRVRQLHSGAFGDQPFTWDGTDERGLAVASGVYVVRAEAAGSTYSAKVALVE